MADRGWTRRRLIVAVLLAALVPAAVVIGVRLLTDDDEDGEAPFALEIPTGWTAVPRERVELEGGNAVAIVRRLKGTGVFVVRRTGRPPQSVGRFASELSDELRKRIRDLRPGRADAIRLKDGLAFSYTYARSRAKTVHQVVIVPAERLGGSFTLDTVVPAGDKRAARDVERMFSSFDLR